MRKYLREILFLAGEDKKKLRIVFFVFLIQAQLELLGIGLIAPYISLVVDFETGVETFYPIISLFELPRKRSSLLTILGCLLIATFACKAIVAYFVNSRIINFVQDKRVDLSQRLMGKYQSLPYVEYTSRNSSEYIHRIQNLTYQYSDQVLAPLMKLLSDGIVALVILVFLAYYNLYALCLMIFLLFSIVGSYDLGTKRQAKENGILANTHATSMLKYINEGIGGLKEIRILGKEKYFYQNVLKAAQEFATTAKKVQLLAVLPKFLLEMVLIVFVVALVVTSGTSNDEAGSLISTLGVFGVASIRLLPIANIVASSLVSIRYARDSISLLYSDCQIGDSIDATSLDGVMQLQKPFKNLSLSNVYYRYPGAKELSLSGISIDVKAGETIGIIGQSGSGKTTLIDLILGLLEPASGQISVNGERLENAYELGRWRNRIAYLPQQVFITDSSLRNNVALGTDNDEIDDLKVLAALKKASLMKVVDVMPDGINTSMGERGVRISGGQAQRVALARAFYHGREILVMDESTSALDGTTEKEIIQEIERLKGKVTLLVIAHRLTTLKNCDRIYELKDGAVIRSGTFSEVVNEK